MTTYNIEQYMKDLEYLVNIDCNAQNFAGIDKVADYLAKDFTGPMWRVKRVDCGPDCAKPLVITNTDDTNYDVTLCCHMDTVFPDGTVAVRPFSVKGDRKSAWPLTRKKKSAAHTSCPGSRNWVPTANTAWFWKRPGQTAHGYWSAKACAIIR